MRVLIIGAAGMLGRKLSERLARDGALGTQAITALARVDVAGGDGIIAADLTEPGVAADLVTARPDVIFDLAAVVSGEAETDLEKGYRVNLDAARHLLEAIRLSGAGYAPRLVFSSSIAVFGPPMPGLIADDHPTTPATSYGTQKAMVELLLADYTRRGLADGIAIRLPTICVRPGAPNLAASGFFSNIIREPLHGRAAVLPVAPDVRHWFASPRAAVGFLIRAATMDTGVLGVRRSLTMPGLSATVSEQIEALRRVAGDAAVALIRPEPDEAIARIVDGWPRAFDARGASELGFTAERDFDEIVAVYVEDEMGGSLG
ncbi:MAG TPA: D-erythronate dehydrogenase [Solirubrobacteraceae bacterium]|jgi:nucleoside-diphosphate-sugar epimerase|nr:D-erythronate dehydrogenase [Solirubrobacteraceae bacterium]